MENMALVTECLGGAGVVGAPKSELDFVPVIRRGFPVKAFHAVSDWTDLSEEVIFKALRIATRTGARRKAKGERLKPAESELLLRLVRLAAMAVDVLGNKQNARDWLLAENRALGGATPISLLDTGIGFRQAMDVLERIDYGVYS